MSQPIRVMIADDDVVFREALAEVLRSDPGCDLVGVASGAGEAIDMAGSLRPDVAILDVKMPDGGGARATSEIRDRSPRTKILGFSAYGDRETVFDLLRRGASGFLVKGSSPAALIDGVHNVFAGRSPLSPSVAHDVVGRLAEVLQSDSEAQAQQRSRLERLRHAMGGGLRIAYQPIVRLIDRRPVGYEALARFDCAPANPERWFAEAADAGLLIDFELTAVKAGLVDRPGGLDTFISLNVSPETILSGRLQDLTLGRGQCVVEVTEHAPVADYDSLARAFAPLKKRGIRLAVDDAGAGFASLRHILMLEPQLIKLDLSLTRGIDENRRQRGLAAALTRFASEIEASVIAEGVETEAEVRALQGLGVELGQGFLFGEPKVQQ